MNHIELLKTFNAWRRGAENIEQPHPTEIGNAIDWAVETLSRLDKWKRMDNQQIRLQCGEMTAEQVRIIRSVLNVIHPTPRHMEEDWRGVKPISNQTKQ